MTVNGMMVIDAVSHAFDLRAENVRVEYGHQMNESNFGLQWNFMPERARLDRNRYFQRFDAETVGRALFVESNTDFACFHTIPTWGVWHDLSPLSVGAEMQRRWPGRVMLYGAVSPQMGPEGIQVLEAQAEEWPIRGVKMYPVDFIDGKMTVWSLADEKQMYPVLGRCQDLGITTIAVHKALPLGGAPMDPFRPGDVDYAAIDWPDLNFEIVHGGFAFLEETCAQLGRFPNVYVNLEANTLLLIKQPRAFARMIGEMLLWGGQKKIFWGTGCMFAHPAPLLDAFSRFQIPDDMIEDYGYPQLTDEIKADILANNFARLHGMDLTAMRERIEANPVDAERDQWRREGGAYWSALPTPALGAR